MKRIENSVFFSVYNIQITIFHCNKKKYSKKKSFERSNTAMIFVCNKFKLTLYLLLLLWHYYSYIVIDVDVAVFCFVPMYTGYYGHFVIFFLSYVFFFVQHLSLSKLVFCFYPNYLLVLFIHIFFKYMWSKFIIGILFVCFIFELFCLLHCLWTHTHTSMTNFM